MLVQVPGALSFETPPGLTTDFLSSGTSVLIRDTCPLTGQPLGNRAAPSVGHSQSREPWVSGQRLRPRSTALRRAFLETPLLVPGSFLRTGALTTLKITARWCGGGGTGAWQPLARPPTPPCPPAEPPNRATLVNGFN